MINQLPLQVLQYYTLLSVGVFLYIQSLKYLAVSTSNWAFSYLNDFLTIPIVATICLHCVWFIKKDKSIRLKFISILSLVLLFSLVFEYYLPKKSYRYTADVWDVVCYFSGGLVFYLLQKIE